MHGAVGFSDKLSVGIALMVIQHYMPLDLDKCTTDCSVDYFQQVLVYACGGASVLGLLASAMLYPMKIGRS